MQTFEQAGCLSVPRSIETFEHALESMAIGLVKPESSFNSAKTTSDILFPSAGIARVPTKGSTTVVSVHRKNNVE